ncbi:unnamed protein product, partial [Anisakis simplex]|uniref:Uncharacterized protein n=1 Tax=Anisakis simplex TaxID=6269 RepID=A0A0M3JAF6_ANISI
MSSTSNERKRNEEMHAKLVNSEKKLSEAQAQIRILQQNVNKLELRNSELVTETNWLKQQLAIPDPPLCVSSTESRNQQRASENELSEQLEKYRRRLEAEQENYESRLSELENEYAQKLASIQEQLINEQLINKKLT